MIKQSFLTDELAGEIAAIYCVDALKPSVVATFKAIIANNLYNELYAKAGKQLAEDAKKLAHDTLFNALFKSLAPFEKKFQAMLKRIWGEEERILIANIKKMKKAWLTKDKVDDILYPTSIFEKKLEKGASQICIEVMEKEGPRVVNLYDFDMVFDVQNPEVTKWLKSYTPMFSEKLEEVNVKRLRATLIEGIEAGEGVPGLTNRVYTLYKDWGFKRAEDIAQNQVIRASNKAALNVYRQSGVVEKKIWVTHFDERTCFPKYTKVVTQKGERNIQSIQVGDIVLTHKGWEKVKDVMNRKYYGNMVKIKTSDRRKLAMTEDHPVYEINKGWVEARKLTIGSQLKTCEDKVVNIVSIQNIKLFNSYHAIPKFIKFFISPNIFRWIRMPVLAINFKANINHWKEKIYATFLNLFNLIFLNKINFKLFKRLPDYFLNRRLPRIFAIARERAKSSCIFLIRAYSEFIATIKTININRWSPAFLRTVFPIISSFAGFSKNLSTPEACFINNKFSFAGNATKDISLPHRFINSERFFTGRANFSNLFRNFPAFYRAKFLLNPTAPNIEFFPALVTYFKGSCSRGFMITMRRAIKGIVRFLNFIFRGKFFATALTYIHNFFRYNNILIKKGQPNIVYSLEVENAHTFFTNGILVHNCPHCEAMDGKVIGLEENFFDLGDESTVKVDDKEQVLKMNYEEIDAGPLHNRCRCSVAAVVD